MPMLTYWENLPARDEPPVSISISSALSSSLTSSGQGYCHQNSFPTKTEFLDFSLSANHLKGLAKINSGSQNVFLS